ncbi:MAG: cupin domain-containing protein [Pseudomonadota bacterium]
MELNSDFTRRVLVRAAENPWRPSPMAGVERRMLDRIGGEVARATTIVRFAPGAEFHAHTHDGGEEFIVLDGVFVDEHGAFPAGSYIRNPPTSHHHPSAPEGTTILVKLHQMQPGDRSHVRIDTGKTRPVAVEGRPGVRVLPLFSDGHEDVRIETWEAGAAVSLDAPAGLEIFVLSGALEADGDAMAGWDWLRVPPGGRVEAVAGPEGARVWVKAEHLGPRLASAAAE